MRYIIDLNTYGITEGSLGAPPYTLEQWAIAKANIDGIWNAIVYARDNNYTEVILPKGVYSICYRTETFSPHVGWNKWTALFYVPSNMTIDLGYSTLEVIYDSDNRSPYDDTQNNIYSLLNTIFAFESCINGCVRNGELKGEIYNRSFNSDGEKSCEGSIGLRVASRSFNSRIENINAHGFMGDSVSGISRSYALPQVSATSPAALPGYLNNDLTVTQRSGCYYSPIININRTVLANATPWMPNTIQMLTSGGYVRIPSFGENHFEGVLLKDGVFSRRIYFSYLDHIYLKPGENQLLILFFNETPGLDSLPASYLIMEAGGNLVVIENCYFHDNHRGGISNVPDYTTIRKCTIANNGVDSGIGAPLFPDSTRYQINIEDTYSRQVIIEDCNIHSGFHGILCGCDQMYIRDCNFSNLGGTAIVVYITTKITIENNRFTGNAAACGLFSWGKHGGHHRQIVFKNNRVTGGSTGLSAGSEDHGSVLFVEGNYFNVNAISTGLGCRTFFNNNLIEINYKSTLPAVRLDGLETFFNNQVYGNGSLTEKISLSPKASGGNYFEKVRLQYNYFSDITLYSDIKIAEGHYKDCSAAYNSIPGEGSLSKLFDSRFKIENCTLENCSFTLPSMVINLTNSNFHSYVEVKNSKILIDDKSPFLMHVTPNRPRMSVIDSVIEYRNEDVKPYFFLCADNRTTQEADITIDNTVVRGISNFKDYISSRGLVP